MHRNRAPWFVLAGALSLACGGVLSAAPSPSSPGSSTGSSSPPSSSVLLHSGSFAHPPVPSASTAAAHLGLSWKGVPIRLKANHLRINLAGRKAVLEGAVELHREKTTLRCERLELRFDEQGQILWARGEGSVTVESPQLHAGAAEVTFDLERSRLLLRGPVQAEQGGVKLQATSAIVDLQSQQLELNDVEGAVTP